MWTLSWFDNNQPDVHFDTDISDHIHHIYIPFLGKRCSNLQNLNDKIVFISRITHTSEGMKYYSIHKTDKREIWQQEFYNMTKVTR